MFQHDIRSMVVSLLRSEGISTVRVTVRGDYVLAIVPHNKLQKAKRVAGAISNRLPGYHLAVQKGDN